MPIVTVSEAIDAYKEGKPLQVQGEDGKWTPVTSWGSFDVHSKFRIPDEDGSAKFLRDFAAMIAMEKIYCKGLRRVADRIEADKARMEELELDNLAKDVLIQRDAERIKELEAEIAKLSEKQKGSQSLSNVSLSMLGNLLAVIHRDGGQREGQVGTATAVSEAMEKISTLISRSDNYDVMVNGYQIDINKLKDEVVQAREQNRLRAPEWTPKEAEAIDQLAKEKDMPPGAVLRQALRLYQMEHVRQVSGRETVNGDSFREDTSFLIGLATAHSSDGRDSAVPRRLEIIVHNIAAKQAELEHLRRWKAEQLAVESEWDPAVIVHEFDLPLGESLRVGIVRKLQEYRKSLADCAQKREHYSLLATELRIQKGNIESILSRLLGEIKRREGGNIGPLLVEAETELERQAREEKR